MSLNTVRGSFPQTRMRRSRIPAFARQLTAEHHIGPADLIQPLFVLEGQGRVEPVASMPGVERYSIDRLLPIAERCAKAGIPAIALFPVIPVEQKDEQGSAAFAPDALMMRAIRELKQALPELGIIADVALDPYTSHGQDGVMDERGVVVNDATVRKLCLQAVLLAQAGADVVAPSDMMDGRIAAIRGALEDEHCTETIILSYAAKYASSFYGPFRDAVGSAGQLKQGNKKNYQMHISNADEALHEVALDLQEGADWVMVKPGMPYLDIIHRVHTQFRVPTFAYQVSGEYSMLQALAASSGVDAMVLFEEALVACKRAGACGVLSYAALTYVEWLEGQSL